MSSYSFIYIVDGKQYLVEVTKKRMKSIRYVYKDGVFKVSIPKLFVTQSHVIEGLNKYAKKLIKAFEKNVEPLYLETISILHKNRVLIKQRDLLLPRLMSGRLEVK